MVIRTWLLILAAVQFARAQNVMWLDSVSAGPGQPVQFSLKVSNAQRFVAFQTDIVLPQTLNYTASSAQLTSRADGHQLVVSLVTPRILRVIAFSLAGNAFHGNVGAVLTFQCQTMTQPGVFAMDLVNPILGDSTQRNILTDWHAGQFTLLAPDIELNADSLDFGSVPLGQSTDQTLIVTNRGTTPLTVRRLFSTHAEARFLDTSSTIIEPANAISRAVRFQPISKGNKAGFLRIESDDPDESVRNVHFRGHAYAVNETRVGSTFCRSGYNTTLSVRINNMERFVAFEFQLQLPGAMKYIAGSVQLSSRRVDHVVFADTLAGNALRVVAFSPTNAAFNGNDGDVVQLGFQVSGAGGIYPVPIANAIIGDSTGANIVSASYPGTLEIASPRIQLSPSAVNFDSVSIRDTVWRTQQVSNIGNDTLQVSSFSINDSSFVNETAPPFALVPGASQNVLLRFHNRAKGQYQARMTVRHNDAAQDPSYVDFTATAFAPNRLIVVSQVSTPFDTLDLPFAIVNAEAFVAFQFDIALPGNLQFVPGSARLSARARDHIISAGILPNGALRILAFSLTQAPFQGDAGEVVRILLSVGSDTGSYLLAPTNLIIGDSINQNIATGTDNGVVWIVSPPDAPILRSPPNAAVGQPTTLILSWNRAARTETYHLQVATDTAFTTLMVNDSTITDTSRTVTGLANGMTYHWRTNAKNAVGTSGWSTVWHFRTIVLLPEQVTLVAPDHNAVIGADSVLLIWRRSQPEVDRYWVAIAVDSLFSNPIEDSTLVDTTAIIHQLVDNQTYWWKAKGHNAAGWGFFCGAWRFRVLLTGVDELVDIPRVFSLGQNYPNPFNPSTIIRYQLPKSDHALLKVYDVLGREVATLVDGVEEPGFKTIDFDGSRLASGVYLYRLTAGAFVSTKKMIVMK